MGNPAKRRTINAMLQRWKRDERRLEELFGVDGEEFSDETEMQRNIGSAIAYAGAFVKRLTPESQS